MAHKHKKPSKHRQEKLARAHHKNDYIAKIRKLCDEITGDPFISTLIPKADLELLFELRSPPPRFETGPGFDIPADLMKEIKTIGPGLLKNHQIKIPENGKFEMSLNDYYSFGFTLNYYIEKLEETKYASASLVKKALLPFNRFFSLNDAVKLDLLNTVFFFMLCYGNFSSRIYWLEMDLRNGEAGRCGPYLCFEVHYYIPERKQFVINGEPRPAFQVGWAFYSKGIELSKIKEAAVDKNKTDSQLLLNVYIQSHAINRLLERLDCVDPGFLEYFVYFSLTDPVINHDKKGNILIEYRYSGFKTGYLLADPQNGAIVIRTFLFLTNNGTPEGEKLNCITGLNKSDHKYLNLDKLSSFMTSDIRSNEKIKEIFKEAGCGSLFEIHEALTYMYNKQDKTSPAMFISKYLNMTEAGESLPPENDAIPK